MTWVVGTPTAFGYACGISDVRATWPDGATLDCAQKIYPVGADIAAAFAGSVRIGFELLDADFLATAAIGSIGSGASVTAYTDILRKISVEPFLWQMEMKFDGAWAKMARHVLQQTIGKNPDATVSPHVHLCTVRRGAIEIIETSHVCRSASGELIESPMPPVATTWAEFEAMYQQAFGRDSGASAAVA